MEIHTKQSITHKQGTMKQIQQLRKNGGVYQATINYDILDIQYDANYDIQVYAREPFKFDLDKNFIWIFSYDNFEVRDIVEISDYDITIDEETNAKSTITVLKNTQAKAKDIIAVKHNNEVVYWGIIDEIQNESGEIKYKFIIKNITNLFDRKIENNTFPSGTGLLSITTVMDSKTYYVTTYGFENDTPTLKEVTTPTDINMVYLIRVGSYYVIRSAHSGRYFTRMEIQFGGNLMNWVVMKEEFTGSDDQLWIFGGGKIKNKATNTEMSYWANQEMVILSGEGFSIGLTQYQDIMQRLGLEDSLEYTIDHHFLNTNDSLVNINWLFVETQTHTPRNVQITNMENGIYNLHTWLTNCNQYYNVTYNFSVAKLDRWRLKMGIKTYERPKELIDTNAMNITNYTEVFETNVTAKVIVKYDKVNEEENPGTYILYLKTDRTTTTDMNDPNRAEGDITTVYTENYEDANQTALDVMKANEYNHNITFNLDRYIAEGTPIAIKTKNSLIFNTYISQIKITPKRFYEYICGNIRINFIEKLKKEKRNA